METVTTFFALLLALISVGCLCLSAEGFIFLRGALRWSLGFGWAALAGIAAFFAYTIGTL